ncbi:hypothetical protein LQF12_05770 [Ruania suaedae]|uniref:HNH endonuclease signature motif containing protein n=1 Tax=Ruania suaedae TaxID=2897774 RepID=UPI001E2A79E9|nr:HNH endonuclease signature motif containing protein [Ruania suaedae]UFU04095.1 hypothetical protein LQF12_05770 [Ruania suaedae]
MTTTPPSGSVVDPRRGVLSSLREARAAASAWEVETARLVVAWVGEHAVADAGAEARERVIGPDEPVEGAVLAGLEAPMRLAGPGAPWVADLEFCELAATLWMSPDAARGYVGEIAELAFRLPRLWERVVCGQVRLWRAREVARSTRVLSAEGAAWVDAQLAPVIGSCSGAQVRRAVAAALDRFDPEAAEARRREADEGRHFDIVLDEPGGPEVVGAGGTVEVDGVLDLADALDLDAAVSATAAQLRAFGSAESLDARRARAVGEIARRELMLAIPPVERAAGDQDSAEPPPTQPSTDPGRRIELILHLSADALDPSCDGRPGSGVVGRCENTRSPVSAEQIRSWCATPGTRVLVRPVVDLSGHYPTESYEIAGRLRHQVTTRDPQCVFPSCTRRARACDLDHIVPFEQGGPTCGCNLAPLCRRHHRAKTHGAWSYVMITPGTYLWTSPSGELVLVDGRGTFPVPSPGAAPGHPPRHAPSPSPHPCGHAAHRDRPGPPERPTPDQPRRSRAPAPTPPKNRPDDPGLDPPPF